MLELDPCVATARHLISYPASNVMNCAMQQVYGEVDLLEPTAAYLEILMLHNVECRVAISSFGVHLMQASLLRRNRRNLHITASYGLTAADISFIAPRMTQGIKLHFWPSRDLCVN